MIHLFGIIQILFFLTAVSGIVGSKKQFDFNPISIPVSSLSATVNSDCAGGLALTITAENADLSSNCLIRLPNGNLFLGGSYDNASLFAEITEEGDIVEAFALDVLPLDEYILSFVADSEGNILCLGHASDPSWIRTTYVIKFNPSSLDVLWSNIIQEDDHNFFDIADPGPGQPYIVVGREHMPPSPGLGNDAMMRTVDRNSGAFTSDIEKNYSLGSAEMFSSVVFHDGSIYICGRYHTTSAFEDMRIAVSRLDLDGNEIWTRLVIHPQSANARMYGRDMVVSENGICFIGVGDPNGTDTELTTSFIGKMDFDGDLLWAREIDLGGLTSQRATNVEKTQTGYFIWAGENIDGGKRIFVHLDEDGEVLSSGQVDDGIDRPIFPFKNNVVVDGDHFQSVHSSNSPSGSIVFINHPLEQPDDSCDQFTPFEVTTSLVQSPANVEHSLFEYARSSTNEDVSLTPMEVELITEEICTCETVEICDNDIDDDMDGLVDCDDPDLQDDCCCQILTPPVILGELSFCEGENSILQIQGSYTNIVWSTGDTTNFIEVLSAGNIGVTVTDSCGNMDDTTVTILAHPPSIGFIDTILNGMPIIINGEIYDQPGMYSQGGFINQYGCDSILNINITNANPELCDNMIDDDMDGLVDCADPELFDSCCCITISPLDLGPDIAIEQGDSAFIFISEGYEGLATWSTGDSGPQILVTDEGWYWAQAEICDSLVNDSVYVTVYNLVDSCESSIYIPNIFSPNGDGINDDFQISFSSELITEIIFKIYNRWGGVEFATEDPYFSWDGQINGKAASPGVYVYVLEVACGGQPMTISGDITIVH